MEKPMIKFLDWNSTRFSITFFTLVTLLITLAIVTRAKNPQTLPTMPLDPCYGKPLVDSVDQARKDAKIVCLKASQEELQAQLEIGGYPKRFVGITPEDACNFTFSSSGNFQNYQQFSTTPSQPSQPQRDSGLAEDDHEPLSPDSNVYQCVGKGSMNPETGCYYMCDMCWQVTQLEENKFPRFINELVCYHPDGLGSGKCLGDPIIGKCYQKSIELQFLKWNGEFEELTNGTDTIIYIQKFEQYTQTIRTCCECEASEELANP